MRRLVRWFAAAGALLIIVGCSTGTSTAGDAGASFDGGLQADAGTARDGGESDASNLDGGAPDGGSPTDAGSASGPTLIVQFDGDEGPGLTACQTIGGHCDRPEMSVASNGTQIAQLTWQNLNVYDPTGTLQKSTPLSSVITSAGLTPTTSAGGPPY